MTTVYRTNNPPFWTAGGSGAGGAVTWTQEDTNWYDKETRLAALEAEITSTVAGIHSISESGGNLYILLTNGHMEGPFSLTFNIWNFTNPPTGAWVSGHSYSVNDVFTNNGSVYLTLIANSLVTFDPGATDGLGHNYYELLLTVPVTTTVQTHSGSTWTPGLADANTYNRFTNGSPGCTVTIPANSSVPFPIGTLIEGRQASTGAVTIDAALGVTVNDQDSSTNITSGQGATFAMKKVGTDEWDLWGRFA